MKEHLQISWLILLKFQIILDCSMNNPGALVANTDTCTSSLKSTASDLMLLSLWYHIPSTLQPHLPAITQSFQELILWSILLEFGQPSLVQHINLAQNPINGAIPPTFRNLTSLAVLRLVRNQFLGNIPNEKGHLRNLQQLQLLENFLDGKPPSSVVNLSMHLQEFCIGYNFLTGSIPRGLSNLKTPRSWTYSKMTLQIPLANLCDYLSLGWDITISSSTYWGVPESKDIGSSP
ncbi:Leucine-rich repeat receptor-like tyrosine-protein kinase PXC3 [Vitis vinifera]|uniref:Leucine-rich repeat receptor-like tyrosine-protein kinase PXC3 n=1 Tax=Vitis vinifera TaxID=29760 RepID=A0A438DAR3_VITVI|nr:Leucine-rich repeat receptor-like tyrosine-protein kinase PXC3 [Vitis vinifera]